MFTIENREMEILHAAVNWDLENLSSLSKNSKTLILGSFNPNNFNPKENTDFYYGRSTNHFWKSIARNLKLPENYFVNNRERKIDCMEKHKFFFFDLINSIKLTCNDEDVLIQYLNEYIFTNYSDKELFRVRPYKFNNQYINKTLEFNYSILEFLEQNNTTRIVHSLGNNRIDNNLTARPLDVNMGFNPFVSQIINISYKNGIEFISTSFSPSQTSVNRGGINYRSNLDYWINQNILTPYPNKKRHN